MACSKVDTELDKILKCAQCCDTVKKHQTLTCYHSVCENCITQLKIGEEGEEQGFQCPVCRAYTGKGKLRTTVLLNELLKKGNDQSGNTMCICEERESGWKCTQCNISLCDVCKKCHLRTPLQRNHTIVDNFDAVVIDPLVFCLMHNNEPVVLNCLQCETPLCMKCSKVPEHENHATETIEKCLERLTSELKEYTSKLEDVTNAIVENVSTKRKKEEELKLSFQKCEKQANINRDAIIEMIQKEHSQLVKQLKVKEEEELTKLEIVDEEMTGKQQECQQVIDWVNTSLESAKGVTLVSEVQGGLLSKLKQLSEFKSEQNLVLNFPSLKAIEKVNNLIGIPEYKSEVFLKLQSKIKYYFPDTLNNLQNVQTINLSEKCTRMGLINGKLWCPVPDNQRIEVIDCKTGNEENDISMTDVIKPRAVQQAVNGDIFLAGDSGLYLLQPDGSVLSKVSHGKYFDVSTDGDITVALKYESSQVHIFMYRNKGWEKQSMFKPKCKNDCDFTILYNNVSRRLYVSNKDTIVQYTLDGVETNKYTGFDWPFLCEIDTKNRLIVAVFHKKKIKIFSSNSESFRLEYYPYSCVLTDRAIWILRFTPPKHYAVTQLTCK